MCLFHGTVEKLQGLITDYLKWIKWISSLVCIFLWILFISLWSYSIIWVPLWFCENIMDSVAHQRTVHQPQTVLTLSVNMSFYIVMIKTFLILVDN